MGSTYSTLETTMLNFMGNPVDSDSTKAMLMASFNWFQNILSLRADWEELETYATKNLTEGVYSYHLLNDWSLNDLRKIYSIKLYDGTRFYSPMPFVTPLKWDGNFATTIHYANSKPSFYSRRGNYIMFDCKADSDLSVEIWYYKYPSPITGTGSVVEFNSSMDPALCAMTVGMTWLGLEEQENAKKWLAIGSGMFKDFSIDIKTVIDLKAFSSVSSPVKDYWSDPFTKEAP